MSTFVCTSITDDIPHVQPGQRSLFCVCNHDSNVYVYGGDSNVGTKNDLWVLNSYVDVFSLYYCVLFFMRI